MSQNDAQQFIKAVAYFATVASEIIRARGSVVARIRGTLVHLLLTVAASVARLAAAVMRASGIQALA